MVPQPKSQAELQIQRAKLASSYNALLEEFSAKELHTVGNYALGRLIGKGSFGKVYLASHKLTNGSKVVLKSTSKDDSNLAREIHHHRQFLHPHIARLYEVIVTETSVWLVLEYCPGDELYHYLTKNGPIEPSTVQKIFAQLVGAVSYVHNKSCVHRDLKLENILLDKNGNVKLCDFGFTREYEGKSSYLQTWCGTICYSAPEMLKGEKYAGEKVDVWSLGIILYALLCGELPFDEDDDNVTKAKILKDQPVFPPTMPEPAKELITSMLSKRPLIRPSLADILTNPWLSEHAPQQQAILKVQQPAPFTTQLEKDTLQRMRSAGVDIDLVIENVLSQRCDALAGWWALLLEKEERKEKRRQRKRKEKEAETRASRRISAASGRFDKLIAPTIKESPEEAYTEHNSRNESSDRGREPIRSNGAAAGMPTLAGLPEVQSTTELSTNEISTTSPPITERRAPSRRMANSPRRHSQLSMREYRRRPSTVHLIATTPEIMNADNNKKRKRRYQQAFFMNQLASLKHWFEKSAKRNKSVNLKNGNNDDDNNKTNQHLSPKAPQNANDSHLRRISTDVGPRRASNTNELEHRPELSARATYPARPRLYTHSSIGSGRRVSGSPSPSTPQSSYRHSNLRGRKSTSSSVSSVRSISLHPHHASHSKASSTSSASLASPSLSTKSSVAGTSSARGRRPSPHTSLKVLPAPSSSPFPSNVRLVRASLGPTLASNSGINANLPSQSASRSRPQPPPTLNLSLALSSLEGQGAFTGFGPPSPGLVFARRKRTPFKGPMLGPGLGGNNGRRRSDGGSASRTNSVKGRRSGDGVIREEDEDEEDEVEEVDTFSPQLGPGEFVSDIYDETSDEKDADVVVDKLEPIDYINVKDYSQDCRVSTHDENEDQNTGKDGQAHRPHEQTTENDKAAETAKPDT